MNIDRGGTHSQTWLPVSGWWTIPGFPEVVICQGRRFRRAGWRQAYPGVVEQYREETPTDSMHLKVYADRRWIIDHVDEDNPDAGREVAHFFNDHPFGKAVKAVSVMLALAACVGVLVAGVSEVARTISRT